MLNPLRLREMIALASCDSGRGSRAEKICRYSKRDYVAVRLIGTFFRTVAGLLLLAGLIAAAYADSLSAAQLRFHRSRCGGRRVYSRSGSFFTAAVLEDFGAEIPGSGKRNAPLCGPSAPARGYDGFACGTI